MSDYNLGTARGQIEVGYKGDGVKKAGDDIDKVTKNYSSAHNSIKNTSKTFALAGGVIAGGLALAVHSAATFESTISGIGAVSGANGKQLDQLRQKALQLGKDTQFSAGEAAQAIEELAKAGIPVPDILNGAADAAVNLAAAGGIDIPQAATLASDAMNSFQLQAKDLAHVSDVYAQAANASSIDISQLGQSMQMLGAVAHLTGFSIDDTAVAIAEMGQAGIKGSDAGTSLKQMFLNLNPQTDKAFELMKNLGIITKEGNNQFFDAKGHVKNLADVQDVLAKALKGMTDQQKQAALAQLFGSDAIRAGAVLSQGGAAGYKKMADAMAHSGTAASVAKARMNNFSGSFEQLKGSIETLAIQLGEILLPILRSVVDHVTSVVNWFISLPGPVKEGIVVFAALAGTLLLGVAAFLKIVDTIESVRKAIMVLKDLQLLSKVGFLANPWVLGIMAVVIVIILLIKYHKQIWAVVKQVWGAIAGFFTTVWGGIKSAFTAFINFIMDNWRYFLTALLTILFGPIGLIAGLIISNWNTIKNFLVSVWGAIQTAASAVWGAIQAVFHAVIGAIVSYFTIQFNIMKTIVTTVWNAIRAVTSAVWGAIKTFISTEVNGILAVIHGVEKVIDIIKSAFTGAYNGVKAVFADIIKFVTGMPGAILRALGDLGHILYDAGKKILEGLWNGMKSVFGSIKDGLGGLAGDLVDWKGPPDYDKTLLTNNGRLIMLGLQRGIEDEIPGLKSLMLSVTHHIESGISVDPASSARVIAAGATTNNSKVVNINTTINNPVAETGADSTSRRMRSLAALGVV